MGIHIEALILFILIFLSRSTILITGVPVEAGSFSAKTELAKLFLFYIPSLALIWHLISKSGKIDIRTAGFKKKDLPAGLITLLCLLITGTAVAFAAAHTGGNSAQTVVRPSTVFDWITLCFFCIILAYLEESYFRFYILTNRKELNLNKVSALALSVALFSICHISGGLWSFINAFIGGSILGFLFLRYNSFQGIAVAHSLYNIAAYAVNFHIN